MSPRGRVVPAGGRASTSQGREVVGDPFFAWDEGPARTSSSVFVGPPPPAFCFLVALAVVVAAKGFVENSGRDGSFPRRRGRSISTGGRGGCCDRRFVENSTISRICPVLGWMVYDDPFVMPNRWKNRDLPLWTGKRSVPGFITYSCSARPFHVYPLIGFGETKISPRGEERYSPYASMERSRWRLRDTLDPLSTRDSLVFASEVRASGTLRTVPRIFTNAPEENVAYPVSGGPRNRACSTAW